jgi:ABC-type enterochelin transport system ATPase subunit
MDTIFDLREISYSYAGKIHALKDTCSRVGHGEISIISYNDSGKSTLLAGTRGSWNELPAAAQDLEIVEQISPKAIITSLVSVFSRISSIQVRISLFLINSINIYNITYCKNFTTEYYLF